MNLIYSKKVNETLSKLTFDKGASYVFLGDRGLGKSLAAKEIIRKNLSCSDTKLYCHPDVLIIEPEDGSVKIDQVRQIKDFMSYLPDSGKVKYVLIDDADTMLEPAQNALLKSLEESSYTVFFLITHRAVLLETIISRSSIINFEPLDEELIKQYASSQGTVDTFILKLCGGHAGLYALYQKKEHIGYIKACKDILTTLSTMSEKRSVLECFHCLKEKDKNNFFEQYDNTQVCLLLAMLKEKFFQALLYQNKNSNLNKCDEVVLHLAKCYSPCSLVIIVKRLTMDINALTRRKGFYTKNDFFDLLRLITVSE